ncbi:dd3d56f1-ca2c-4c91-8788-bed281f89cae [Thermothielavioides terrestris]|uniref:Dd3d56f1-ca2c-4c91-8788-bed281f89cae n=1 Tax=Thermothielavioides terrestris TaxID=2587410 RepID=A0A3S4ASK7_9PEZI|nr:dd3d56f1-ca2c-4c91-8788-bed281f89cae [Thermothielavioides terrestris]
MFLADLFSMILRLSELAFGAIVAGLNGDYLHAAQHADSWQLHRFIYAEVVAGVSIFFAVVGLFPFSGCFIHWPADFFISVAWFVAFGLLVDWLSGNCGYVFDWDGLTFDVTASCAQWKATIAFSFLSAICWLVSALLG